MPQHATLEPIHTCQKHRNHTNLQIVHTCNVLSIRRRIQWPMAQQIVTLLRIKKTRKKTKGVADMAYTMTVHYSAEAQSVPSANSGLLVSKA